MIAPRCEPSHAAPWRCAHCATRIADPGRPPTCAAPPAADPRDRDAARWRCYERELPQSAGTVRTFVDARLAQDPPPPNSSAAPDARPSAVTLRDGTVLEIVRDPGALATPAPIADPAAALAARLRAAAPATGHTVVPDELPPAALRYLADFDMDDVGNSRGVAAQECWAELLRRLQAAAPPPGTTRHQVVACRCWPCNAPGRGPQ